MAIGDGSYQQVTQYTEQPLRDTPSQGVAIGDGSYQQVTQCTEQPLRDTPSQGVAIGDGSYQQVTQYTEQPIRENTKVWPLPRCEIHLAKVCPLEMVLINK